MNSLFFFLSLILWVFLGDCCCFYSFCTDLSQMSGWIKPFRKNQRIIHSELHSYFVLLFFGFIFILLMFCSVEAKKTKSLDFNYLTQKGIHILVVLTDLKYRSHCYSFYANKSSSNSLFNANGIKPICKDVTL